MLDWYVNGSGQTQDLGTGKSGFKFSCIIYRVTFIKKSLAS